MHTDPPYLSHFGELATLKCTIASWYHQDAYLDFDSDQAIWSDIMSSHDEPSRQRIIFQLRELLNRTDQEIMALWNANSHSHLYRDPNEAKRFLTDMLSYFEQF